MKANSLRWGVIFIGAGILWLLINFGSIDFDVWMRLFSLWPILLIAVGIEMIFKRSKLPQLAYISPLIVAAAYLIAIFGSWSGCGLNICWDDDDYSYKREVKEFVVEKDSTIENLEVNIDYGLGELWIGPTDNKLFAGDFEFRKLEPTVKYKTDLSTGKVYLKTRDIHSIRSFSKNYYKNDSRIFLADYLPVDLDIDVGAADISLDLADLMISSLRLDSGASAIEIRLGCDMDVIDIDIDTGASGIVIEVPRDMGLKIDTDAALSTTNFSRLGLFKQGDRYTSDNFETASCRALINIDSGVSSIEIDYY